MKNYNSHKYEYGLLKNTKPSMGYDGSIPLDEWKSQAKSKLTELLGLPFDECEGKAEIEYSKECDGYTEHRFSVQTEPGYYVPCHLRIPSGIRDPIPLTLCLSGHGGGMHIALGVAKNEKDEASLRSWHHRAMAPRSNKEGRAALVIEARNFGEASLTGYGTSCTEAAKIAILMGRTVIGERVWDAMRILDAVEAAFPEIDMSNIVCTGNSGGGTAAYYLACLDERITVAAPSCSICTYEDSIAAMPHCLCNHIPGIRKYFEMGDLAGLIAPRRLVIAAGETDDIFPIGGTKRCFEKIKFIYESAKAGDNCALVIGDGGHLNYADLIWKQIHDMGI